MTQALGLTDGSAGMISQVKSLASAMNVELELVTISINPLWKYLPNMAFDLGLAKFFPVSAQEFPELPELVISCGRKAALVAAMLHERHPTPARFIHIQDPQMEVRHFDVIIVMEHDRPRGPNILTVPYALTDITPEILAHARERWEPKFEHLPRPWNAVLIGGSTTKYRFTSEAMHKLIGHIDQITGSLLITTSRRTGEINGELLHAHFANHTMRTFIYTGQVENPYLGMLACADRIYVTNDSVNMMSEAMATGKPVHVLKLDGHENTKPSRFAERMLMQKADPHVMMREIAQSVGEMLARGA